MKTRLLTIAFGIFLLAIIGGAYLLTSLAQPIVPATIKFDPNFIEWDGTAPTIWRAWIQSADGSFNPANVNGSTVLFEYTVPASGGSYDRGKWIAQFDGQAVWNILTAKINHLGVPPDISTKTPVHYYFTVSGRLLPTKAYPEGATFEGQGWIAVRFVQGLPEPPPPPP